MFLWLSETLRDAFGPLNVFRYVTFRILASLVTAYLISMALYPWFIRRMQLKQIGQTVRTDGPKSHFSKAGTPTMGGALIILAMAVSTLLWMDLDNHYVWLTLIVTLSYGILGFMDDYKKFRERNSKGVSGRMKLLWQATVAGAVMIAFFWWLRDDPSYTFSLRLYVPFLRIDQYYIDLPAWAYASFGVIVLVGASNAVNLTDGLDGLAIGPTIIAAATFLLLCYLTSLKIHKFDVSAYLLIPKVKGVQELSILAASIIGAGFGFLWYNTFPAQVFMGDVGALALGGALGCLAIFSKNELLSVIILGVFVVEAVSVIAQTTSFKLTGKRVFKMAPIHHHFELKGWAEPKIIVRFWIIAIMLALFALSSIKLR